MIKCDSEEEQEASRSGLSYLTAGDLAVMTMAGVAIIVPPASVLRHKASNQAPPP